MDTALKVNRLEIREETGKSGMHVIRRKLPVMGRDVQRIGDGANWLRVTGFLREAALKVGLASPFLRPALRIECFKRYHGEI